MLNWTGLFILCTIKKCMSTSICKHHAVCYRSQPIVLSKGDLQLELNKQCTHSLSSTGNSLICLSVCRVSNLITSVRALSASRLHVAGFPGLLSANTAACMLTYCDLLSSMFGLMCVCLSGRQTLREWRFT